jgi:hypothetical protein
VNEEGMDGMSKYGWGSEYRSGESGRWNRGPSMETSEWTDILGIALPL